MAHASRKIRRRNVISGLLFGAGLVAFIDEVIFHQLLRWHHFYDLSSTSIGLISDGIFHAFSWFATIFGLFLFADLRRRDDFISRLWFAGTFIGIGFFQLYDGFIQHKLLGIHQIRYVDNVWVYDIVWNLLALLILVVGLTLLRGSERKSEIVGNGT
ncbi:DUF2243 domain-containing protein [Alkalihalobacillus pseudalcaliphilus]|uniref:DUF2243 domain-containing protein n=1 Tax=Alkalihalobacillus pseudalcaliphilus TaxID=79884 RepID=UPI00064DFB41|nr:DUF2243 domain-containing protein [Alkalihalobacillus pseudalcaliphilus]KMK76872.1 membrane protein [Alkalihalobacillus pseudalcaliphilus]